MHTHTRLPGGPRARIANSSLSPTPLTRRGCYSAASLHPGSCQRTASSMPAAINNPNSPNTGAGSAGQALPAPGRPQPPPGARQRLPGPPGPPRAAAAARGPSPRTKEAAPGPAPGPAPPRAWGGGGERGPAVCVGGGLSAACARYSRGRPGSASWCPSCCPSPCSGSTSSGPEGRREAGPRGVRGAGRPLAAPCGAAARPGGAGPGRAVPGGGEAALRAPRCAGGAPLSLRRRDGGRASRSAQGREPPSFLLLLLLPSSSCCRCRPSLPPLPSRPPAPPGSSEARIRIRPRGRWRRRGGGGEPRRSRESGGSLARAPPSCHRRGRGGGAGAGAGSRPLSAPPPRVVFPLWGCQRRVPWGALGLTRVERAPRMGVGWKLVPKRSDSSRGRLSAPCLCYHRQPPAVPPGRSSHTFLSPARGADSSLLAAPLGTAGWKKPNYSHPSVLMARSFIWPHQLTRTAP